MLHLLDAVEALIAATPSPSPSPQFDPVTVTPGWVGFVITFLIAIVTVALILDMTRRVRRVRYRAEVREMLDAEEASESNDNKRQ